MNINTEGQTSPSTLLLSENSAAMARIGPLLLPLLLLSRYGVCVHSKELSLTPIDLAPVPCNDKAVGKLSRLAMTYINEDRPDGYKFALNRVANVHLHAQVSTAAQTAQEAACGWNPLCWGLFSHF